MVYPFGYYSVLTFYSLAYANTLVWIWKALEQTFSGFLSYKENKCLDSLQLMLKAKYLKYDKVLKQSQ